MIENFRIGGFDVEPGSVSHGFLRLLDGQFELPATVICGRQEGRTVLITAGVHAGEYVGIEAAIRLSRMLTPDCMAGTVVIIKAVNRPAFEARTGSMGKADGKNLNRVFPGIKDGSEMERLAYALAHGVFPLIDYYIDLHSGDTFEELMPYVYYAGAAPEETARASRAMAAQTEVPYMVRSDVAGGGAYNFAASTGIPSVLIERGGMGLRPKEEVAADCRDVCRILSHLGVWAGETYPAKEEPREVSGLVYGEARQAGLWYPSKMPGDFFAAGEILGEVRDYEDGVLEVCRAAYDGVILYQAGSLQVLAGGTTVAYGRLRPREDGSPSGKYDAGVWKTADGVAAHDGEV